MLREILEEVQNEKVVTAQGHKELIELIANCEIPLSTKMMDRLGYSYDIDKAFHITNAKYLPQLSTLQGTKKQLSCFTKGSNALKRLPSNPNILVELSGNVVLEAKSDMWTDVDKQGRRWIILASSSDDTGTVHSEKLRFFIEGIRNSILKELGYDIPEDSYARVMQVKFHMTKPDRAKLYKMYFDRVEKYLNKEGYKLLNKHLEENIVFDYNEIVINNIKIVGAYDFDGNLKDEIEKTTKYLGIKTLDEISKIKV